jgi:hypothetical protein
MTHSGCSYNTAFSRNIGLTEHPHDFKNIMYNNFLLAFSGVSNLNRQNRKPCSNMQKVMKTQFCDKEIKLHVAITMTTRHTSEEKAADLGLPRNVAHPTLMTYRSVGIGVFGVVIRYAGMPLEKIALFMNSSQVQGKGQFAHAVRLTFKEGALASYRAVGPTSLCAWFLQYSVMGVAFQFFDQSLSRLLDVEPVYYGPDLMKPPPPPQDSNQSIDYHLRSAAVRIASPFLCCLPGIDIVQPSRSSTLLWTCEVCQHGKGFTYERRDSDAGSSIPSKRDAQRHHVPDELPTHAHDISIVRSTRTKIQNVLVLVWFGLEYFCWKRRRHYAASPMESVIGLPATAWTYSLPRHYSPRTELPPCLHCPSGSLVFS